MDDQERMNYCMQWLAEHPDAPLMERAARATVVACGGDPDGSCTFGDIALYAGASASDVMQGLLALKERQEAEGEDPS